VRSTSVPCGPSQYYYYQKDKRTEDVGTCRQSSALPVIGERAVAIYLCLNGHSVMPVLILMTWRTVQRRTG